MPGCFHESPVARKRSAPRFGSSVERCRLIGPDYDLAAIAAGLSGGIYGGRRINADRGSSTYDERFQRGARICRNGRITFATADIAANQNLAATGLPRRVDRCGRKLDIFAADDDSPTLGVLPLTRGRNRPRQLNPLRRRACRFGRSGRRAQDDHAVLGPDRIGLDHTGIVDDGIHHLTGSGGSEFDTPAIRFELSVILDQRIKRLTGRDIDDLGGNRIRLRPT